MLNHFKKFICFSVLLMGLGFASLSHANVEVSGHGGFNYQIGDIKLEELGAGQTGAATYFTPQRAHAFDLGVDVLYRLPMNDMAAAVGLRYRHQNTFMAREHQTNESATAEPTEFGFNANRVALLGNYRFLNNPEGLFVGIVLAVDVWRHLNFSMGPKDGEDSTVEIIGNQFWPPAGQAGIELGWKINPNLFVKGEVGFSYLQFSELECGAGSICQNNLGSILNPERKFPEDNDSLSFHSIYATIGLGYFFG